MGISVCLPYYKRAAALERFKKENIRNLEISVFDDGAEKDYPLNPCVPINKAIRQSTGSIICLTNPEIEGWSGALLEMADLLENKNDYVMARCWDVERDMWLADKSVDYSKDGRLPVPPGAHFHFCVMFYRELFDLVGGFDEDYRHGQACEDNDWLWRLHTYGVNFILSKAIVFHHDTKLNWNLPHNKKLFFEKWPQLLS